MHETGFDVALGRLAALRNDGRGPRVLALHGWLDNAASFLPMAPYLRGFGISRIPEIWYLSPRKAAPCSGMSSTATGRPVRSNSVRNWSKSASNLLRRGL